MPTVTLPDGNTVAVSTTPEAWWHDHGATGYLDPNLLFPDPHQPRKAVGGGDWKEFVESVSTLGVREYIRVMPLANAPWVTPPAGSSYHFVIVSGHRRHQAALEAALPAVPVTIHQYSDETSHRADADMLNAGRKDLTPLEEGIEIGRRRLLGHTWEKIATDRGMSVLTCMGRHRLLNLAPDIQILIDPVARSGRRSDFPIKVAEALGTITKVSAIEFPTQLEAYNLQARDASLQPHEGEQQFAFALQRALLAFIQARNYTALKAVEFITKGEISGHKKHGPRTHYQSTSGLIRTIKQAARGPTRHSGEPFTKTEIHSVCRDLSDQELEMLLVTASQGVTEATRLRDAVAHAVAQRADRARAAARVHTPPPPPPVRTQADMSAAEIAAITQRYLKP